MKKLGDMIMVGVGGGETSGGRWRRFARRIIFLVGLEDVCLQIIAPKRPIMTTTTAKAASVAATAASAAAVAAAVTSSSPAVAAAAAAPGPLDP